MNVTEFLEKWGRTLFEGPVARTAPLESPRELAEIRFAVLEEVRRHSYRAGARIVFPFDLVRVNLRGVEEERAPVFRSSFFRQYIEHEICGNLRADSVRFPDQLRLEVDVATGLPLPNEPWLTVAVASLQQTADGQAPARLVVRSGSANAGELAIEKPRVYIGREVDVYRNGSIHRRNDLAIADESVSREHAHIDHDKIAGVYRLFNDRTYTPGADCGMRIVRDGVSRAVPRDTRGTKLEPGDEIHLGRAIVVFTR